MGDWVSDPTVWCKKREDLVRWCTDQVVQEPRATAPSAFWARARVVNAALERLNPKQPFRVGDLYYTPWQTKGETGRLAGTLDCSDPFIHPATLTLTLYRNGNASADIELASGPPDGNPFSLPDATPLFDSGGGPSDGLKMQFGGAAWLLILKPAYQQTW